MSKALGKDLFFNFVYNGLNVAFPLIVFPYVARTLSVEGFGAATLALTTATYFTTIASLGIPIYGVREVARAKQSQQSLNKLVTELLLLNSLGVIVASALFAVSVFFIDSMRAHPLLFIVASINIVLSFFQVDWLFQGVGNFKALAVRGIISKLLALMLLFQFVNDKHDSVGFVLANVISLSFSNLLNIVLSRRLVRLQFRELNFRQHAQSVISFSATRLASSVYTLLDTVMLAILANMYYVAFYAVSIKLIRVLNALINSASGVFFSKLSSIEAGENLYRNKLELAYCGLLIVTLPTLLGLIIYGSEVIITFAGPQYNESVLAMIVLSPLIVISMLTSFIGVQVLYIHGEERNVANSLFIGATICILANLLLIPQYRHLGAAISTVTAEFFILFYQIYVCIAKGYSLDFFFSKNARKIYKAFLFMTPAALFIHYLASYTPTTGLRLMLAIIFLPLAWAIILIVSRERISIRLAESVYEYFRQRLL